MASLATYTYDAALADPVSQARLHLADTDVNNPQQVPLFTDQELTYFLSVSSNDPILAAAMALDSAAVDAAKIAVILSVGDVGEGGMKLDRTKVSEQLGLRAEKLRLLADIAPVISAPDQIFSTDYGTGQFPGTMSPW